MSEDAGLEGSADMLLYARSPLSKRGRFLVLEESASSIGSLSGVWGPADFARVGVTGCRVKLESMTWWTRNCSGREEGQELNAVSTVREAFGMRFELCNIEARVREWLVLS